jgi:CRISPR-associated protein Csy2
MNFLYLPRIRVQAANAHATSWLINSAPLMALNMFAHNLGRKICAFPKGVAVIHHDAQLLGERGSAFYGRFHPQQRRGATFINGEDYSSKNEHALSLQPTASCHLTLSLVLTFDEGIDKDAVMDFMKSARISGGQVIDCGDPEIINDDEKLRHRLKTGFWVIERPDLMQSQGDPLDAVIRAAAVRQDTSEPGEIPNSWIVPTVLGYATITGFQQRGGVREGYPHAFCESLVGLVQYVSLRDYGERPIPFWSHQWLGEDVFVINQKEKQS